VAYWLDIVGDEPFVRMKAAEGADPVLATFLDRAWGAWLAAGGGDRLRSKRHGAKLQIEYEVDDGEVARLFVEILSVSPDPAFPVALFGALRATGRLHDLPLAHGLGKALVTSAVFESPDADDDVLAWCDDEPPARDEDAHRQRFVELVRAPLRHLARARVAAGEYPFELDLWPRGDDFLAHVVSGPDSPVRDLVVGAMVTTGRIGFDVDPPFPARPVRLQLVVRA
jgi:hypothetical protein